MKNAKRQLYDFKIGLAGYRHSNYEASVFARNQAEARQKARRIARQSVVRKLRKR